MMPVLIKIPGLGWEVPGYGLALMIGFLLSIVWAARRAQRSGANPDVVLNCGFIALIGGIVGSRAMYVLHYWDQFNRYDTAFQTFRAIIDVRKGGLEVYGGFLLVVAAVIIYLWRGRHSIRWYFDILAPSAALGMAIGRVGCLLNGCCWGGLCTELPWGVTFPFGSGAARQQWVDHKHGAGCPQELLYFAPQGVLQDGGAAFPITRESLRAGDQEVAAVQRAADEASARMVTLSAQIVRTTDPAQQARLKAEHVAAQYVAAKYLDLRTRMKDCGLSATELGAIAGRHRSLPVHPTQVYSTITLGLLALLLSAVYWRRTRDGQVILTMLLIEPWTRWMIELLRADQPLDTMGGLTISQGVAIGVSAFGLLGLILLRHLPPRAKSAVLWEPDEEGTTP